MEACDGWFCRDKILTTFVLALVIVCISYVIFYCYSSSSHRGKTNKRLQTIQQKCQQQFLQQQQHGMFGRYNPLCGKQSSHHQQLRHGTRVRLWARVRSSRGVVAIVTALSTIKRMLFPRAPFHGIERLAEVLLLGNIGGESTSFPYSCRSSRCRRDNNNNSDNNGNNSDHSNNYYYSHSISGFSNHPPSPHSLTIAGLGMGALSPVVPMIPTSPPSMVSLFGYSKRKPKLLTLVLDLDETLIHSAATPLEPYNLRGGTLCRHDFHLTIRCPRNNNNNNNNNNNSSNNTNNLTALNATKNGSKFNSSSSLASCP